MSSDKIPGGRRLLTLSLTPELEKSVRAEAERTGKTVSQVAREFLKRGIQSTVRKRHLERKEWLNEMNEIRERVENAIVAQWTDKPEDEVRRFVQILMTHRPYDELLSVEEWQRELEVNVIGHFRDHIMRGGAYGPEGFPGPR